ncbi:MAG: Flp pilus assembly complex ATPase component TadA [Phycisphaeraceae bacterium]|nr:Flp pilus assembly complex ATPase component TadA [Phycisphaeraceae bacterium]
MDFWLYDHSKNSRTTLSIEKEPVTIGRDENCEIRIVAPFVNRRHARIFLKGNQMFVESLGKSATLVSNREIAEGKPARIDFGDEVQIAQFSIVAVSPGRKDRLADDRRQLQKKLMEFEQKVHAQLLERMNLRITGHIDKSDSSYTGEILRHMQEVIDKGLSRLNEEVINHIVHTHLHREVIAEVVRQCQGKVQTEYIAGDERLLDPQREQAIGELVGSIVDMMPLLFDSATVAEDLTVAEDAFDDLFEQILPDMSAALRKYIVRRTVSKDLEDIMFGLGPLQDLVNMANVNEIMVVGREHIYVEKNGVIQPTTRSFFSDEVLLSIIERILAPVGRRVDTANPLVDARLADGSRVNAIIQPLSLVGPCLTIRKFGWIPFTIDDLVDRGSLSPTTAEFLKGCVVGRKNIIISGGTGSGKTTLLNTLGAFVRPSERIITIEESAELRLPQPHIVGLEGRPANVEGRGAFTIRELVRNALRMRPDRIIVGEVRGPEALDMLQAMNTGHDGSLSTVHANTPVDAMKRLETLVLMAVDMPVRAIREQIVGAIDLVVQVARFSNGRRRVTHISEVMEIDRETGEILLEDIYRLRREDQPTLRHTGYIPKFAHELIEKDQIEVSVFL